MKIISFSDLHLEFGIDFSVPRDDLADILILAGDIITFGNYDPLLSLLKNWNKPVLYVAGNHEYYTKRPMLLENDNFKKWASTNIPHMKFLNNESVSIEGVHFFGGTMWTDFNQSNIKAMLHAQAGMNDFRLIRTLDDHTTLTAQNTIHLHDAYKQKLTAWFETPLVGPRVVISHHAPALNRNTQYKDSPLMPAFNSLDMGEIIEHYQPELWVYGHTHECDDQFIGKTRVLSNQLGYKNGLGGFECADFMRDGCPVDVGN